MATSRRSFQQPLTQMAEEDKTEAVQRFQEAADTGTFDKMAVAKRAMDQINKKFAAKKGSPYAIYTANQLPSVERIQSGWIAFDCITGGGFPRRRATQVKGPNHVGKTTVILDALALQQSIGEVGIWVQGEEYDQ